MSHSPATYVQPGNTANIIYCTCIKGGRKKKRGRESKQSATFDSLYGLAGGRINEKPFLFLWDILPSLFMRDFHSPSSMGLNQEQERRYAISIHGRVQIKTTFKRNDSTLISSLSVGTPNVGTLFTDLCRFLDSQRRGALHRCDLMRPESHSPIFWIRSSRMRSDGGRL